MTLIHFTKAHSALVSTFTQVLSEFCGFQIPAPTLVDDWVVFQQAQLESEEGFYAHKYEGVHCLPFRLAIHPAKFARQVAIDQAAALNERILISSHLRHRRRKGQP